MVNLLKYSNQLVNPWLSVNDGLPYSFPTFKFVHIYIHKYLLGFATVKKNSWFTHFL